MDDRNKFSLVLIIMLLSISIISVIIDMPYAIKRNEIINKLSGDCINSCLLEGKEGGELVAYINYDFYNLSEDDYFCHCKGEQLPNNTEVN